MRRFSSRRQRLDHAFLSERLRGATAYRRIAGYFRSSIFELVGEEISQIPKVQMVCNSELDAADVVVAQYARETALKERWNETSPEVEALLHRDRYRHLHNLLISGRVEIRVVPKDRVFIHGKAGIIEQGGGSTTCFMGSINETKSAFATNYEILWEDPSPEGVAWVEEEFSALWEDAFPLPDAIIEEIERIAKRVEVKVVDVSAGDLPGAALAEAPIYRGGEQLQPWQRSFVTTFLDHRDRYKKARLLLADEVGVGKTLSLAAAAMVSCLLDDGPVLILCPATLTMQWQVELVDKIGIPSAVWSSAKKLWLDYRGHEIRTRGPQDIANCPSQIAIVSTGLIFQGASEREHLLKRKYGTVILDEAHRARQRGELGKPQKTPNNLLEFMIEIAGRTRHLVLGTATPIQTDPAELWNLLTILSTNATFVLGRDDYSRWRRIDQALPLVKGESEAEDTHDAWSWVQDPLPPESENKVFENLRRHMNIPENQFFAAKGPGSLEFVEDEILTDALEPGFFEKHNPIVRHTILRRRSTLETQGLLERIGVNVHPEPKAEAGTYPGVNFEGLGLVTNHPFNAAYKAAEEFTKALRRRSKAAGFMKTLLLQRICSSFAAGKSTAERLRRRENIEEEEETQHKIEEMLDGMTVEEENHLNNIVEALSRPEARDPKIKAVTYFLTEHRAATKTWLEHGCIVFSQYYDTVEALGEALVNEMPNEPIGIYAGAGKSGILRAGNRVSVEREQIKAEIRTHKIRLLVATDAACEGLNLQTLGTMINVDLPWNPSRLEQRLGRIKRFGQRRDTVDMLNLVYQGTQDERVYEVLSQRMKDRYDIFGSLPDTIDDDWIDDIERLDEMMDRYMHLRRKARDAFEIRYEDQVNPDLERWELCSRVLARRDIVERLSKPW